MDSKDVLNGAAVVVLMAVVGIIVLAGTILLMMWAQPGIAKSPSEQSYLSVPDCTNSTVDCLASGRIVQPARRMRSFV